MLARVNLLRCLHPGRTHRYEHTPALIQRATAAAEADKKYHTAYGHQAVAQVLQEIGSHVFSRSEMKQMCFCRIQDYPDAHDEEYTAGELRSTRDW